MDRRAVAWEIKLLMYGLEENGDLNSLRPLKVLDERINTVLKLFDTALYNEYYATGVRYIHGTFYQVYFGWESEDKIRKYFSPDDEEFYIASKHLKSTLQKTYNYERLTHPPIKELLEALWQRQ